MKVSLLFAVGNGSVSLGVVIAASQAGRVGSALALRVGIFGEHLYKSLEKIRSRPVFVVDSIVNPPVSSETEGREKIEKMILSLWSIRKQKTTYASSINSLSSDQEAE